MLLDTHILLWWAEDESLIAPAAGDAIRAADSLAMSAASAWEISLKLNLGKLETTVDDVLGHYERCGFDFLSITPAHAWAGGALPLHHRDPFDRLLVAQAQLDGYTIVTRDSKIARYGVATLAA